MLGEVFCILVVLKALGFGVRVWNLPAPQNGPALCRWSSDYVAVAKPLGKPYPASKDGAKLFSEFAQLSLTARVATHLHKPSQRLVSDLGHMFGFSLG